MVPSEEMQSSDEVETGSRCSPVIKERHSLYVRFPKKLNSDRTLAKTEVHALHPKIIRVRIPRQKSANFCMIDFESKEDKEKALKKIKKIQINDKNLIVKESVRSDKNKVKKKSEKVQVKREVNQALRQLVGEIKMSLTKDYGKSNITNGVMIRDLKAGITQADVKKIFPRAIDVKMNMKAERKNSFALVWMPTPVDAKEAAKKAVQINGEEFVVSLLKDKKLHNSPQKPQPAKTSNGKAENRNKSENNSTSEESDVENMDSDDEVNESD